MGVIADLIKRLKEKKEINWKTGQQVYAMVLEAMAVQEQQIAKLDAFQKQYLSEPRYSLKELNNILSSKDLDRDFPGLRSVEAADFLEWIEKNPAKARKYVAV